MSTCECTRTFSRMSSWMASRVNIEHKGLIVHKAMHNDLTQIVNDHTSKVNATYHDDCFQKLFWMQQQRHQPLQMLDQCCGTHS